MFARSGSKLLIVVGLLSVAAAAGVHAQSANNLDAAERHVMSLHRDGRHHDAASIAQRALGVAERRFGPWSVEVGDWHHVLATIERARGREADANLHKTRAMDIYARALPEDPADALVAPRAYFYLDEEGKLLYRRSRQKSSAQKP